MTDTCGITSDFPSISYLAKDPRWEEHRQICDLPAGHDTGRTCMDLHHAADGDQFHVHVECPAGIHGFTTPDTIQAGIDRTLINHPITHPDANTSRLAALYAQVIAAELDRLAAAGPLLTPDLLHRRARFLRAGIRTEDVTP